MSLVRTIAGTSLRKRPGRTLTAILLLAAALIALLQLRSGRNEQVEMPAAAPDSRSTGSVAKLEQASPPPERDSDSRAALQVEPSAGQAARASGDPERPAHVFGFVRQPDRQLAKSIRVEWNKKPQSTLQVQFFRPPGSAEGSQAQQPNLDVLDGRFEGDVPEGLWILRVVGNALTDDLNQHASFVEPVAALRRLKAGSTTQVDFEFRPPGTCCIQGKVFDEEGRPFGGLRIQVFELHEMIEPSTREKVSDSRTVGLASTSQDEGAFSAMGLPPGRLQLLIDPRAFMPTGPPNVSLVGEVPQASEFELLQGRMTVQLSVRRARPVHVTGRVEIDAAWAAEHGLAGQTPYVELVGFFGFGATTNLREPIALEPQGFAFWIDAGVREPRLEAQLGRVTIVEPLTLAAGIDPAPLTIRFPR